MAELDEGGAPPAGEEIHMPGPTILPLLNAVGVMLMILGVTLTILMTIAGALLFLSTAAIWIRDVRRDISELPLDHRH